MQNENLTILTAACAAHRACCGCENDLANGKIHGYCVVCGIVWPCEVAKTFIDTALAASAAKDARIVELEKVQTEANWHIRNAGQELRDLRAELAKVSAERDALRNIIDSGKGQSALSIVLEERDALALRVEALVSLVRRNMHGMDTKERREWDEQARAALTPQ